MAFHPYPRLIPSVFNRSGFGPPQGLTPASAWPRVDHPASRLRRATGRVALFRLAFAAARQSLGLAARRNSQAHSTKGTPSRRVRALRLLVGARFQALFHSPLGVLFTFPSRYSSTIGHPGVFSLGGRSPQLRPGFHVPGPTRGHAGEAACASRTGLSPGIAGLPMPFRCACGLQPPGRARPLPSHAPQPRRASASRLDGAAGLGSRAFARRYSRVLV